MEQEKKENLEQIRREKNKKRIGHFLLVYAMCLLVAFVVWLLVQYNVNRKEAMEEATVCTYECPVTDACEL